MCEAIQSEKNWKGGNTEVHTVGDISTVKLHGNLIAVIGDDWMKLHDGGFQSKTTKSRLNALLHRFGYEMNGEVEKIFQKKGEWFVTVFNTTFNEYQTVNFRDGMILS